MIDEFTTEMHEELIGMEVSHNDLQVMSVYGMINQGVPKQKALKEHKMSEKYYDANIDRVLHPKI